MRSPHRIPPFLRVIEYVWMQHPDMRFGQLLDNIAQRQDTWEWENSRWTEAIERWTSENQSAPTHGVKP